MKRAIMALSLLSSAAVADEPELIWSLQGFEHPESVVVVPGKQQYLVSNIVGHPAEKDGEGSISLLSSSGEWIDKHWVVGLDAPKGMAISGDKLFVSDLAVLRMLRLSDGVLLETHTHPQAKFLNDVASDEDGNVYISDMMSGAIYRYADGEFRRWLELTDIPHPNGLSFDAGRLLLASWGQGMHEDFSTDVKGGLFSIDLETRVVTEIESAQGFGNLDAVEVTTSGILTNDWITGDVFHVDDKGPSKMFNAGGTAADFAIEGDRILIPVMMENRVDVYQLHNGD